MAARRMQSCESAGGTGRRRRLGASVNRGGVTPAADTDTDTDSDNDTDSDTDSRRDVTAPNPQLAATRIQTYKASYFFF